MVFVMTLFFIFGAAQGYGAEKRTEKNPIPKAKTISEARFLETTYHALIIGNNQYKYLPILKTARNDAIEVDKLLKEKFGFQTELLLDASRIDILGRINELRKRLGEKDNLLIYYAGHGEYDKNVDKAYWLPVDAQRDNPTNWIMAEDITSNIKRISARHVLVVSDSCYSGTLTRQAVTELITTGGRDGYLNKMMERPSRTLMASGGNEPVSDSGGGNNSVFAAAFLKALNESNKESFSAEELFHARIKAIVAGKSQQVPEYNSIKNSGDEGGDFVFRLASLEIKGIKEAAVEEKPKKRELSTTTAPQLSQVPPDESTRRITNSIGMEFRLIPEGTFMMGSPPDEPGRGGDETQHRVTISRSFFLQTTEVTQGQWKSIMGNNPSHFSKCGDDCPVEQVSWNDAQEFIRRLNQKEGSKKYRLPTEAEWEYAARAGTTTPFHAGKCISTDQANYDGNNALSDCPRGEYRRSPVLVGSFPPNAWRIYDMHGNVMEWCRDQYENYSKDPVTDPKGLSEGPARVLRGGSWNQIAGLTRSAFRYWAFPDKTRNDIGFRVARDY
jgi:formylglycine-generating enzyme required for sulfatase activity